MKHLISQNDYDGYLMDTQLFSNPDLSRKVISKIYDIEDEVIIIEKCPNFLVDLDVFLEYFEKYDGCFAGNCFDTKDQVNEVLQKFQLLNTAIGQSPTIYIAPYYISRTIKNIVEFEDVYADTIYINISDIILDKLKTDKEYSKSLNKELKDFKKSINANEMHIVESISNKKYLRFWWD